jgi:hypothetical protein
MLKEHERMTTATTIFAIITIVSTIGILASTTFAPLAIAARNGPGGVGACHYFDHNQLGLPGTFAEDACDPSQSH